MYISLKALFHKSKIIKFLAIQCNISGTSNFITCRSAPMPNDITWENITMSQIDIETKKWRVGTLLVISAMFWTSVVSFLGNFNDPMLWERLGVPDEANIAQRPFFVS